MLEKPTQVPVNKTSEVERTSTQVGWPSFNHLRGEIDRLFEEFNTFEWTLPFRSRLPQPLKSQDDWRFVPAIDVAENKKAFSVTAELPGLDPDDIDIRLSNGALVIKGQKESATETDDGDYYLSERRYGSFCRTLAVPDGVDRDHISAEFSKGILKITLPKSAETLKSEKKIAVKAA